MTLTFDERGLDAKKLGNSKDYLSKFRQLTFL